VSATNASRVGVDVDAIAPSQPSQTVSPSPRVAGQHGAVMLRDELAEAAWLVARWHREGIAAGVKA